MIVRLECTMEGAIVIRNALKLLLQLTPCDGRSEVEQVLAGVELRIAAMLRQEHIQDDM